MHLTDDELGAMLNADDRGEAARAGRAHLAQCAECREAVAQLRESDSEIADLLHVLDHPPGTVQFSTIVERATRGAREERSLRLVPGGNSRSAAPRRALRWAGVILAGAAAVAVASVPSSPVRRLIANVTTQPAARSAVPVPSVAAPSVVPSPTLSRGIGIVPRRGEAAVVFSMLPVGGRISVRTAAFNAAGGVSVLASGDGARYGVTRDSIRVDNREASGIDFVVTVPAAQDLPVVSIAVGDQVVFSRRGGSVETTLQRDANGGWSSGKPEARP
jgi:hypothetical protein